MPIDSTILNAVIQFPLSVLLQSAVLVVLLSGWLGYRIGRHQAQRSSQKKLLHLHLSLGIPSLRNKSPLSFKVTLIPD